MGSSDFAHSGHFFVEIMYAVIFTRPFLAPCSGLQPELAQNAEALLGFALGWREPEGQMR